MKKNKYIISIILLFFVLNILFGCNIASSQNTSSNQSHENLSQSSIEYDSSQNSWQIPSQSSRDVSSAALESTYKFSLSDIPEFTNSAYYIVNDNKPFFGAENLEENSYEKYSDLDSLGRCGTAIACIGTDIMPTEERGSIGAVKPSGWQTVKYDNVEGKYLYNRCHLIGYQLSGENANEKNLITGTRYLNTQGMLPFENMIADYVKETDNHVLYRVTPVFAGDNLVASGVLMEAKSVEDNGEGVEFCVYSYNNQPDITIEYSTGASVQNGDVIPQQSSESSNLQEESDIKKEEMTYILNTNTMKFHYESCTSVQSIKEYNKTTYTGQREDLIEQGYLPCGKCKP